jgi:hypothetical protein
MNMMLPGEIISKWENKIINNKKRRKPEKCMGGLCLLADRRQKEYKRFCTQ